MLPRLKNTNPLLPAFVCLLLIFAFSCEQKERYEGVYKARGGEAANNSDTQIELKENGLGVWRTIDDEVSFRWDVKDSEIWLHTKSGGIIIGKIQDDTIEITLPGSRIMSFKKSSEELALKL